MVDYGYSHAESLLPMGSSFEAEQHGQFRFEIEISSPPVGLIVAYKGMFKPAELELAARAPVWGPPGFD